MRVCLHPLLAVFLAGALAVINAGAVIGKGMEHTFASTDAVDNMKMLRLPMLRLESLRPM
jgi:hypothetical protein